MVPVGDRKQFFTGCVEKDHHHTKDQDHEVADVDQRQSLPVPGESVAQGEPFNHGFSDQPHCFTISYLHKINTIAIIKINPICSFINSLLQTDQMMGRSQPGISGIAGEIFGTNAPLLRIWKCNLNIKH